MNLLNHHYRMNLQYLQHHPNRMNQQTRMNPPIQTTRQTRQTRTIRQYLHHFQMTLLHHRIRPCLQCPQFPQFRMIH